MLRSSCSLRSAARRLVRVVQCPRRDRELAAAAGGGSLPERAVFTVAEVTALLDLSMGLTYALVCDGTIPADFALDELRRHPAA